LTTFITESEILGILMSTLWTGQLYGEWLPTSSTKISSFRILGMAIRALHEEVSSVPEIVTTVYVEWVLLSS